MCGMNSEMLTDPTGKFQLFVDLVQKQVILFGNHAVTVTAVFAEYLETYIIISMHKKGFPFGKGN